MDIQAVRSEIATFAPEGVKGYDYLPGNAQLPTMVVGLPVSVTYDASFRLASVELPIVVAVSGQSGKDVESALLTQATDVAEALRGARGTSFHTSQVSGIRDFGVIEVGASQHLSATIYLTVLVNK